MASRDLRRPVASTRLGTAADPDTSRSDSGAGPDSRRRFLRRAATGGVLAVGATTIPLSVLAPAALAQTNGSTPGSSPGLNPGSTPPGSLPAAGSAADATGGAAGAAAKKPTVGGVDLTTAVYLQTVSLALAEVYDAAEDTGKLHTQTLEQGRLFARQHREHATRLADFAQSAALNKPNQALLDALTAKVKGANTETDLVGVLGGIEDGAAATYFWGLGEIEEWELAAVIATILPVEAQHAVAWSRLAELDLTRWVPQFDRFVPVRQEETDRFDPAQYPVGKG